MAVLAPSRERTTMQGTLLIHDKAFVKWGVLEIIEDKQDEEDNSL